uniref:Uncharacterized protein n=1 Tax=Oryza punctata TaxID=4537 RepID=A0A0E0JTZ9_ORYPU
MHVRTDYDDGRWRKGHDHGGAMRMQSGRDELGRTKTRWPTPAQLERIERMKEEEEDDDDDHETVREIVAPPPPPANGTPSVETKLQVPEIVEQSVVEGDEWLRTRDGKPTMSLFDDDEPIVRRDGHGGSRRAYGDIGGYHGSKGRWPRDPEVERLEREKEMNKYDNKSKPTTTRKVKVVPTIGKRNQYGAAGSYPPHAPPPPPAGGHQPATSSYLRPIYYH